MCQVLVQMTKNGILLPKIFWPNVRKNCSGDREKLLKSEAEFNKNCSDLSLFE